MFFKQIVDEKLAQYAYLVGCQGTRQALLIDPQRDIDRYVAIARREGLRIAAVAETHIHADFLSGCLEFVDRHGCRAYLSAEGGPGWRYAWAEGRGSVTLLRDGDRFDVGGIDFQAVHTPGHTPEHMSFLITDRGAGASEPMGMVSGDFVFVGDLGRPDLLESAAGQRGRDGTFGAAPLRLGPRSFRAARLPAHLARPRRGQRLRQGARRCPGHHRRVRKALQPRAGRRPQRRGRLCLVHPGGPARTSPLFRPHEGTEPAGSAHSRAASHGRASCPARSSCRPRGTSGAVVVDTRPDRLAYYGGHLPGSIYAPLNKSFPTVTGCYVDPASEIVLICRGTEVEQAVRDLVRIGLDRVAGWAPPDALPGFAAAGGEMSSIEVIDFEEVGRRAPDPGTQVLDVRRATEFAEGRIDGAANIAHTRLASRLGELPRDRQLLVHCLSGARASAAASLLEREGFEVAAVNDIFTGAYRHPG